MAWNTVWKHRDIRLPSHCDMFIYRLSLSLFIQHLCGLRFQHRLRDQLYVHRPQHNLFVPPVRELPAKSPVRAPPQSTTTSVVQTIPTMVILAPTVVSATTPTPAETQMCPQTNIKTRNMSGTRHYIARLS